MFSKAKKVTAACLLGLLLGMTVVLMVSRCTQPQFVLGNQTGLSKQYQQAAHIVADQLRREKEEPLEYAASVEQDREGRILVFHLKYIGSGAARAAGEDGPMPQQDRIILYDTLLGKTSRSQLPEVQQPEAKSPEAKPPLAKSSEAKP